MATLKTIPSWITRISNLESGSNHISTIDLLFKYEDLITELLDNIDIITEEKTKNPIQPKLDLSKTNEELRLELQNARSEISKLKREIQTLKDNQITRLVFY